MMKVRRLHYGVRMRGGTAPICRSTIRSGARSDQFRTTVYRFRVTCCACARIARIQS